MEAWTGLTICQHAPGQAAPAREISMTYTSVCRRLAATPLKGSRRLFRPWFASIGRIHPVSPGSHVSDVCSLVWTHICVQLHFLPPACAGVRP